MIVKLRRLVVLFFLLISMSISGCASKDVVNENKNNLIFQESISPNEQYVDNQEDVVHYTVEVYQENDDTLSIHAKSNSKLFEPLDYEFYIDKSFSKDDITVEWTTLMGSAEATKENQLCIAMVKVKGTNEAIKINFINRGIELIKDALAK